MGAALEIVIIPTLLLLAIIVGGVVANFSIGTVLIAGVAAFLLLFGVIMLLRKEKEWLDDEGDAEQGGDAR